jgi:MATE family multidrug resistance protein
VPMLLFAVCLWGVGLGGGYVLGFNVTGWTPPAMQGARGFWIASTAGLVLAGLSLSALLAMVLKGTPGRPKSP